MSRKIPLLLSTVLVTRDCLTTTHPYIPLPLRKGGEEVFERGKTPLNFPYLFQECLREATPLFLTLPLPLSREGGKGDRLLNNPIISY